MLAHFLHIPLEVIYRFEEGEKIRPQDERSILLALQLHHRVRRVHLLDPYVTWSSFFSFKWAWGELDVSVQKILPN